jgi:hypothetical protein
LSRLDLAHDFQIEVNRIMEDKSFRTERRMYMHDQGDKTEKLAPNVEVKSHTSLKQKVVVALGEARAWAKTQPW